MRWLRRLASAAGWAAVLVVLASSLSLPVAGLDDPRLRLTIVSGTSMLPTYEPDDLLVTWRSGSYDVGDSIVYRIPEGETGGGIHVVHRITAVNPDGTYTLLGDNNDGEDLWTPSDADVQGRVALAVPRGGLAIRWFFSPAALALLTGVLVAASVWEWQRGRASGTDGGGGDGDRPGRRGATGRPRRRTVGPRLLRRREPGGVHRAALPPARSRRLAALGTATVATLALGVPYSSAATLGGVQAADLYATAMPASVDVPNPTVSYTQTVTTEWTEGFCASLTVTNATPVPQTWTLTIPMMAPYNSNTQPTSGQLRTVSWTSAAWVVQGPLYAPTLAPGASYTAAWCGTRTPPPVVPGDPAITVSVAVTPPSNPSSSTCVDVTVSTTSPTFVTWEAVIDRTTAGLTDPVYWLTGAPSPYSVAQVHSWDPATGRVAFRGNTATNAVVKAGTPREFRYCYPLNTAAPLVDSPLSATVTATWGVNSHCATITVSTTSTTWRRWRATISRTTPGLSSPSTWLTAAPGASGATTISFAAGTWVVRGVSYNEFIRAGSPATFTYCQG